MRKKRLKALACVLTMGIAVTGCATAKNETTTEVLDTATVEIRQNDYRGGITRSLAVKDGILSLIEDMKSNNVIIRADSPNTFWTNEDYQDFVTNFMSNALINDTMYFNEEESTFADVVAQMGMYENSFSTVSNDTYSLNSTVTITRNEKDDYSISDSSTSNYITIGSQKFSGTISDRILYDCDKDWCKAYTQLNTGNEKLNTDLFEYARIDEDTFAIQTKTERIIITYESVSVPDEETDANLYSDLRNRTIKSFYYSRLSQGVRSTFNTYEILETVDEETNEYLSANEKLNDYYEGYDYVINENGDVCTNYGKNDTIFYEDFKADSWDALDWVFEDTSLQQAILYKDGILVVNTYNKLSDTYERFTYIASEDAKSMDIEQLENKIDCTKLTGSTYVKDITPKYAIADEVSTSTDTEEIIEITTEEITDVDGDGIDDAATFKTSETAYTNIEDE